MAGYRISQWSADNNLNNTGCKSGYINGARIKSIQNGYYAHETSGIAATYGYNSLKVLKPGEDGLPVYENVNVHSATLGYSLITGTESKSGSRFEFRLDANGGVCYTDGAKFEKPGITYDCKVDLSGQAPIASGPVELQVTGGLGVEHQGYHLNKTDLDPAANNSLPDYMSKTSADLHLGLKAIKFTNFSAEIGAQTGCALNIQKTGEQSNTFLDPTVGGYAEIGVLIPNNSQVTPCFFAEGDINYSWGEVLGIPTTGSKYSGQVRAGIKLFF